MTALGPVYAKLPHVGSMRLLEQVARWDDANIRCLTGTHRAPDNPLRGAGGLAAVHAVEYAAQAAAVHGILCGPLDGGPVLLLAAAGDIELLCSRLDDCPGALCIDACLEARVGASARYRFVVGDGERPCARGTITLMPGAEAVP